MNPFQKWLLIGSSAGTGLTGIVYAWMKYLLDPAEPWAVINHPWEPWVLKAHILVAPVMVFAVGLIATEHIWKHFRARVRARRISGLTLMAVLVPMVASGYLIQAVTGAPWLTVLVWVHLITGGVYLVGLGIHWAVRGRRRTRVYGPLEEECAHDGVSCDAVDCPRARRTRIVAAAEAKRSASAAGARQRGSARPRRGSGTTA